MFTYVGVMSPQGRKAFAVIHRKMYSLSASGVVISFPSYLQTFKTRHDFQAVLCYDVRLVNFLVLLHHPVWVDEECKERKRTF